MANRIQQRRDTAANWASANPVLAVGEPGYETDTKKSKIGDGTTTWTALGYQAPNEAVLHSTFVRFEDLAGNPISVRQVVIKVDTTTWEIADIVAEA